MTVYVIRDGKLVDKAALVKVPELERLDMFPTPRISRMEPFESPVTGAEITSWRARDADMRAADAYDPRDIKKG